MTKRMLIDATQPEETRVVLVDGIRLDDFDFEASNQRQLKGNIYLAKVTRVEPSLQAAFIEYGGERHGFLAFGEIHPDYYRIPVEDRQALIESQEGPALRDPDDEVDGDEQVGDDEAEPAETAPPEETDPAESVGRGRARRQGAARRYRIQEVISRRQILLVQVVKEQRGNKGASLTTYLSLAGRYCVLMPNNPRGGGVSRKITNAADRNRLKKIVEELDVPEGMAIIVRTAGRERTKSEIKRDCEYLLRLWDRIREQTLVSSAPCLVHEEANLIRRSIRDLYTRDIEEVLVQGDEGYRTAKSFMKMLIPSHARRVQPFREDGAPLLHHYQVENQLTAIHEATVPLQSGGYLVIDQTEALVAIDVNSGRATRARSVEDTALRTNMEAASEVARQLRLRDLAGLIVIDFIDMAESRNQTAVERRMKEAVKLDRARIQLGRISQFGLMELSRQRLRPSVFETSTVVCPHCQGSGRVRSTESSALQALRAIEEEGVKQRASRIAVWLSSTTGFYILNSKRMALIDIEQRYGFEAVLEPDDTLLSAECRIEVLEAKAAGDRLAQFASPPEQAAASEEPRSGNRRRRRSDRKRSDAEGQVEQASAQPEAAADDNTEDGDAGRKRRRRGKRGGRRRGRRSEAEVESGQEELQAADAPAGQPAGDGEQPADGDVEPVAVAPPPSRRRRSRGRSSSRTSAEAVQDPVATSDAIPVDGSATKEAIETSEMDPGTDDTPVEETVVGTAQGNGAATEHGNEPVAASGTPATGPAGTLHAGDAPATAETVPVFGAEGPADGHSMPDMQSPANGDAAPDSEVAADDATVPDSADEPVSGTVEEAVPPEDDDQPAAPGLVVEIMSDGGVVQLEGDAPPEETPAAPMPVPETGQPPRRGWWNRPEG
ncbi:MAG: Rne/Rng family ribonuclease [Alphaproteobacteria bacterium]|nr:Rne/Rng family ribonuclease [Alphaproteobacteria bacterium]